MSCERAGVSRDSATNPTPPVEPKRDKESEVALSAVRDATCEERVDRMVDDGGLEPPQNRIESLSAFLTRPLVRITLAWILLANIMCGLDTPATEVVVKILLPLA